MSLGWTELPPTRFPRLGSFNFLFLFSLFTAPRLTLGTTHRSPRTISTPLKGTGDRCVFQFCLVGSLSQLVRWPWRPQHAMNGTPRLTSAFPQTPQTIPRRRKLFETPSRSQSRDGRDGRDRASPSKSPSKVPKPQPQPQPLNTNTPLVPTNLIDAPSQRLYVAAFWLLLNSWRVYESWTASDELDSTWLFLKWMSVDGIFLFGLQALRIPWLEWAFPTTLAVFLVHMVGNMFLMFRIPVSCPALVYCDSPLTVLVTLGCVAFRSC